MQHSVQGSLRLLLTLLKHLSLLVAFSTGLGCATTAVNQESGDSARKIINGYTVGDQLVDTISSEENVLPHAELLFRVTFEQFLDTPLTRLVQSTRTMFLRPWLPGSFAVHDDNVVIPNAKLSTLEWYDRSGRLLKRVPIHHDVRYVCDARRGVVVLAGDTIFQIDSAATITPIAAGVPADRIFCAYGDCIYQHRGSVWSSTGERLSPLGYQMLSSVYSLSPLGGRRSYAIHLIDGSDPGVQTTIFSDGQILLQRVDSSFCELDLGEFSGVTVVDANSDSIALVLQRIFGDERDDVLVVFSTDGTCRSSRPIPIPRSQERMMNDNILFWQSGVEYAFSEESGLFAMVIDEQGIAVYQVLLP